ncbi:GNAT family N-acetyltransferase [Rugosibacter aromaticivorans]|uniref:GNAT family N-acetyltransferase n=1 Tax=Rugosibacter aromaticivorans TaxID=1565605 RepID=UPI000A76842E|nr:GNAT family N-acetyltransferase [Rugosibacter aromaticivorans]TBR14345.1 MAG: GNAT family N-acetyltransferase [Rugosibacter sp.]
MIVHRFNDFAAFRAAIGGKPAEQASDHGAFFQTTDWFELLAQHGLPAGTPLQWLMATNDGSPILGLPLIQEPGRLTSLSNFYTPLYAPLLLRDGLNASTWPEDSLPACALAATTHFLRHNAPRPAVIQLQPLDIADAFYPAMRNALITAGYAVDSYFCFGNWTLPCRGLRFADYFARRPSALQNTMHRARKKLERAGAWKIDIHTQSGESLGAAITAFETIYQRSWKPSEAFPDFVRRLCALAAQRGWLRLGVLSLNGVALASQIWLVDQGKAAIFKLAYDPDAARYSPGSLLTAALMEYVLEHDAVDEIDYLSGDDPYKQDWMSHRRERHGLIAFDLAMPRGLFAAARHYGGKELRIWRTGRTA